LVHFAVNGGTPNMRDPCTAQVNTAYSKRKAQSYDSKRFASKGGKAIHDREFGILQRALEFAAREPRILEVGCGTGRLLVELCRDGHRVDGVDASVHMLEECRSKLGPEASHVELRVGDGASLPYRKGTYDLVYCIRMINQTESKQYAMGVISELIRVARPNGFVLVEFVNSCRPCVKGYNEGGVRLKPSEVLGASSKEWNTVPVWQRGAFLLGMTVYNAVPDSLVPLTSKLDRALSWALPSLCSRSYILLQKK